jgi:D-arabinose 1-dehydrogenase-like Zn-dependent alcohol dehydrogenase
VKASVYHLIEPYKLKINEESLALDIGRNEIKCETIVSAISPGTELGAYIGLPNLRGGYGYPRVQGYCNVAEVIEVGSSVKDFKKNDLVLTAASHRSHFIISEAKALKLPSDCKPEEVVFAYLYHLGYNAVLRSEMRLGNSVLVLGLGLLGITTVAMASIGGAQVTGLTEHARAAKLAVELGAKSTFTRHELLDKNQENSFDIVILTTNTWSDWDLAMKYVAMRGTIATLGFPGRSESPGKYNPLDSQYFYAKQLRIESIGYSPEFPDSRGFLRFNEKDNLKYIVGLITSNTLNPKALIAKEIQSENLEVAYRELLDKKLSPLTYILRWKK